MHSQNRTSIILLLNIYIEWNRVNQELIVIWAGIVDPNSELIMELWFKGCRFRLGSIYIFLLLFTLFFFFLFNSRTNPPIEKNLFSSTQKLERVNGEIYRCQTFVSGEWFKSNQTVKSGHGPWTMMAPPLSPLNPSFWEPVLIRWVVYQKVREWGPIEIRCLVDFPCFPSKMDPI